MSKNAYLPLGEVVAARIFWHKEDDGYCWNVDGVRERGLRGADCDNYTEWCARFATWQEAVDYLPEFFAAIDAARGGGTTPHPPTTTKAREP